MADGDRFPSSIPTEALTKVWVADAAGDLHATSVIHLKDAPKLYAYWAEGLHGKLDELRLHDNTGDPRDDGYMACLADVVAALGLGDRSS